MLHIGGSFGFFLRMLHIDKRLRGFAFKFEIVLESADNSVRKDKGRYLNERCVVARKVRYRADLARNCC